MIKIESIEAIDPKFCIKYFDEEGYPREKIFNELIELVFWLHAIGEDNLCFSDKGYIEVSINKLSITKEFWDIICEIIYLGYAEKKEATND